MIENPDFEQSYWSTTSAGIYEIGHDSVRLMKWLAFYDRFYYEKLNSYDFMASIFSCTSHLRLFIFASLII